MSTKFSMSFIHYDAAKGTVNVPSHNIVDDVPLDKDRTDITKAGRGGTNKKFSTEAIQTLLSMKWVQ